MRVVRRVKVNALAEKDKRLFKVPHYCRTPVETSIHPSPHPNPRPAPGLTLRLQVLVAHSWEKTFVPLPHQSAAFRFVAGVDAEWPPRYPPQQYPKGKGKGGILADGMGVGKTSAPLTDHHTPPPPQPVPPHPPTPTTTPAANLTPNPPSLTHSPVESIGGIFLREILALHNDVPKQRRASLIIAPNQQVWVQPQRATLRRAAPHPTAPRRASHPCPAFGLRGSSMRPYRIGASSPATQSIL